MLEKIDALLEQLGRPQTLLADNGYFSEANVMACAAANIEPLGATGREPHHPSMPDVLHPAGICGHSLTSQYLLMRFHTSTAARPDNSRASIGDIVEFVWCATRRGRGDRLKTAKRGIPRR